MGYALDPPVHFQAARTPNPPDAGVSTAADAHEMRKHKQGHNQQFSLLAKQRVELLGNQVDLPTHPTCRGHQGSCAVLSALSCLGSELY